MEQEMYDIQDFNRGNRGALNGGPGVMNRIIINTENDEFQIIKSLKVNRIKRKKSREVFIEGIECIKQAMIAKVEITRIIIWDINNLSDWGKKTIRRHENAKIIEMSQRLYNTLSDKENPSELLATAKIKQNKLEDFYAQNPYILLFDRPSDYGNLGSIIRSANAFNIDAIFIIGHGIDIYDPKVIRASLGSIFFTRIINIESMEILEKYIKEQKMKNSIKVIGTDSTGDVSLKNEKLNRPIMIILGNEAKGMSVGLRELCDKIIRIPMEGNTNSLNVSCAASIIMWETYKNT
jgi:TrmH family RNA methyltransferase